MDALLAARCFACLFFAVCFLQSGTDKVVDFKGNLDYLGGHFESSPLGRAVPLLLITITVLEVTTGLVCAVGLVTLLLGWTGSVPAAGLSLACLTLCMLFGGQRIAKDYQGAATLAVYFGVALLGLLVLSHPA